MGFRHHNRLPSKLCTGIRTVMAATALCAAIVSSRAQTTDPPVFAKDTVPCQNPVKKWPDTLLVSHPVRLQEYFGFMDSLLSIYGPGAPYPLSEHLLVQANPWILDSLEATDYYRLAARDSFVYDQKKLIVLDKGQRIVIPDSLRGLQIQSFIHSLRLDINIPEFTMRIFSDTLLLHSLPIRVGKNTSRFLAMSGRETDLRTRTGSGKIVRIEKNPKFYNPVDGKVFFTTLRDDGKRTLMPQIPWLETEIDGVRNGQMIHPTTNPSTLGKASSNGCIGSSEAAGWIIYYHAPVGTPVRIRYDLRASDPGSGFGPPKDIYNLRNLSPVRN